MDSSLAKETSLIKGHNLSHKHSENNRKNSKNGCKHYKTVKKTCSVTMNQLRNKLTELKTSRSSVRHKQKLETSINHSNLESLTRQPFLSG